MSRMTCLLLYPASLIGRESGPEEQMVLEAGVDRGQDVIRAAGGLVWRDSPRGRLLAVVHRNRYDDWTLPKGKLDPAESWTDAAVREVREETGCRVRVGRFAASTSYSVGDCPKVVLFWHMDVLGECGGRLDSEVAEVAWLTVDEARERLSYPLERALLDGARRAARVANEYRQRCGRRSVLHTCRHRRRRRPGQPAAIRLGAAPRERIAGVPNRAGQLVANLAQPASQPAGVRWADAAFLPLDRAEAALRANDPGLGWRCLKAATRLELAGLAALPDRAAFDARARFVYREASEKLTSWRRAAVLDLLGKDGELDPQVSVARVAGAAEMLHEHQDNLYFKLAVVDRQLVILIAIAVVVVAAWIIAAPVTGAFVDSRIPWARAFSSWRSSCSGSWVRR